jgi:hypothetical protein
VEEMAALWFKEGSALARSVFLSSRMHKLLSSIKVSPLKPSYVTVDLTTSFFARGVVERAIHSR